MFYVYELFDPATGDAFYVGKGKGNRRLHHLNEALSGKRSAKCDRIRLILDSGGEYSSRVVSHHKCEKEALAVEADLIAFYGLAALTNVLPNGWCHVPPEYDPVASAKKVVLALIPRLRWAMLCKAAGIKPALCGEQIDALFSHLRGAVGQEFFDKAVGVVSSRKAGNRLLVTITAEGYANA